MLKCPKGIVTVINKYLGLVSTCTQDTAYTHYYYMSNYVDSYQCGFLEYEVSLTNTIVTNREIRIDIFIASKNI